MIFTKGSMQSVKSNALVLSLEVLHTALVIDMIPLHSGWFNHPKHTKTNNTILFIWLTITNVYKCEAKNKKLCHHAHIVNGVQNISDLPPTFIVWTKINTETIYLYVQQNNDMLNVWNNMREKWHRVKCQPHTHRSSISPYQQSSAESVLSGNSLLGRVLRSWIMPSLERHLPKLTTGQWVSQSACRLFNLFCTDPLLLHTPAVSSGSHVLTGVWWIL